MRGYEYREFLGHRGFFTNAELRFPMVTAMATPLGVLGGIRGVFYFNIGGAALNNQSFNMWSTDTVYVPGTTPSGQPAVRPVSGFRLVDGRASYGFGLETFALGFPIHFDWAWRSLFNKSWEDALFAAGGGSEHFRTSEFKVWVGYDF